ncbi:MAG: hypothetical protein Q3965_01870 [Rothia sp. (in: high G+C Gram-positive bacteria)]|nr:hypothetical protein [Rothia sp. (in: high G+C Gram-positive bacteria)]
MPIDPKNTQIKETAYTLAKKYGWALEYNGGLELDGEFLDDADLSDVRSEGGQQVEYVLNISYADTTAYGFTLTREVSRQDGAAQPGATGSFGAGASFGASSAASSFGAGAFAAGLPGESAVTVAEKYYVTTVAELLEAADEALAKTAA